MEQIKYKVENLNKDDNINRCVDIISNVLGKNYINNEKILLMINDNHFICLKAIIDNKIIGIAISCIMTQDEALEYLKIEKYKIPQTLKCSKQIAIIKTIAIERDFQKKGIASFFIKKLENCFVNKNIHLIFCVAWRHNNIENIGSLMLKNSYTSLFIIEKYYEKDSLIEGFSCPVCGENGCHCAANIYFKII